MSEGEKKGGAELNIVSYRKDRMTDCQSLPKRKKGNMKGEREKEREEREKRREEKQP